MRAVLLILVIAALGSSARAARWEFEGNAELETRYFVHEAAYPGQHDARPAGMISLMPELHVISDDGNNRISLVPMFRGDTSDDERTFSDIKEFYWLKIADRWDLHVGMDRIFWGVAESRHLVDIINQKDLSADIAEEDQLGQPMVNLGLQTEAGDINFFVLPKFRPRRFPGEEGRLRPSYPIVNDEEIYVGSADEDHMDVALRYFGIVGDFDIGLSWFRGVSREPSFFPRAVAVSRVPRPGDLELVPVYELITQVAADIQLTRGPFLWKLEALRRRADMDDFFAMVAGLEYTFYGVNRGWDLGVLAEYLYDERHPLLMPTPFEDDVYVGMRLALNDLDSTSILAGAIVDTDSDERFFSLELETRLADGWTLNLEVRAISGSIGETFDFGIGRDDYLSVTIGYAF